MSLCKTVQSGWGFGNEVFAGNGAGQPGVSETATGNGGSNLRSGAKGTGALAEPSYVPLSPVVCGAGLGIP
jgi:hypothetical protein